jgi:hypothetical protein
MRWVPHTGGPVACGFLLVSARLKSYLAVLDRLKERVDANSPADSGEGEPMQL